MATINKSSKPLVVNPLKTSAFMGAALAYLGVDRSIPLLHSAQGCCAFAKVYFVRHFREPIPLQTSAMDHVATVMNADENLIEALAHLAGKQKPAMIGVATSGLVETQGSDVSRIIKTFRERHPEHAATRVVWASTPDFRGGFEQGFAEALYCMIDQLVPALSAVRSTEKSQPSLNLLCPAWMTPGDQEALAEIVEDFGLRPMLLPNLARSLDGHLGEARLNACSQGGASIDEIEGMVNAAASLVFGRSLRAAGDLLATRCGVKSYQLDDCMGLRATDRLLQVLAEVSGQAVPAKYLRQRQQYQDALLDSHFMLTGARVALAAEPDHLGQFLGLLEEVGAVPVSAVCPSSTPWLNELAAENITIGDLEDWENEARKADAELLITNSHGKTTSERLHIPLLRAGFPQYDWLGGYQRVWLGYRGARQTLFDLGNLWTEHHEHADQLTPYLSRFRSGAENSTGEHGGAHEHTTGLC